MMQKPLAAAISTKRAPVSRAAYAEIGGGSPIMKWTNAQASGLETQLSSKGIKGAKCYVAMRYWHPFTDEALSEMQKDGINALVVLPLYPHYSVSTSGSSLGELQKAFEKNIQDWSFRKVVHTVVPHWYKRPGYIESISTLALRELEKYSPAERAEGVKVLFSAHGVPKSYVEAGDPYKRHIEECTSLVAQSLEKKIKASGMNGKIACELSFQSRVGPVEWLRPYTDDKIRDMGEAGVKNLVVVPVSFVSEHIETLEEIDMEYKELAEECGIQHWERVPALNTEPKFMEDMADMVIEAMAAPRVSIAETLATAKAPVGKRPGKVQVPRRTPAPVPQREKEESFGKQLAKLPRISQNVQAGSLLSLMFIVDGVGRQLMSDSPSPMLNAMMMMQQLFT
ncbi:unnamed protein product [Chrysoparadoxa australica]